jgi:hypothetical protein
LCTGMRSIGAPSTGLSTVTLGLAASVVSGVAVEACGDEGSAEAG